jgi:hypothetical protein
MSVFLTPSLKPVLGGTYFPPEDRYQRPGFRSLITQLGEAWRHKRASLESRSDAIIEQIRLQVLAPAKVLEMLYVISSATLLSSPSHEVVYQRFFCKFKYSQQVVWKRSPRKPFEVASYKLRVSLIPKRLALGRVTITPSDASLLVRFFVLSLLSVFLWLVASVLHQHPSFRVQWSSISCFVYMMVGRMVIVK